jgi:hypothetical protein
MPTPFHHSRPSITWCCAPGRAALERFYLEVLGCSFEKRRQGKLSGYARRAGR